MQEPMNGKRKRRLYTYMLFLLGGMMLTQCSSEDTDASESYKSYWYYSYEAETKITAEKLGFSNETFSPYTVAHLGDTLFIANISDTGNSIVLMDAKSYEVIHILRSWNLGGVKKTFGSQIEAIVPTGNRLYVVERQSRIHAFDLPSLNYISCIGNGNWNGEVFQSQAMIVKDSLIFSRDKSGQISVYKEREVTPENYEKVKRYRRAVANGQVNNGFAPQHMVLNEEGNILLTDYDGRKIRVLNPALVTDEFKNGGSIDLKEKELTVTFKPKTMALTTARFYVTGDNNAINVYARELKEWTKSFNKIAGYDFSQPARVHVQNDSVVWVSDTHSNKRALIKMKVYRNEIREYERISDRVVRTEGNGSRSSGTKRIWVDVRTHEVITEEE